jgi:hypothetical protein
LRLEQELAADAVAARLTGSSQIYLQTLASLAVRHAARPAPWPLRAFLPAPGTLLRRLEMLRDTRQGQMTSKRWRRGVAGLLVVLCAALVAGVRPEQPATAEAEQMAVKRNQSRDNLKHIALAFHNYYHTHNERFPSAVLRGPDGKTPYSWRVAILPLLGAQALYDQYDRNQPWDSEHNRKVLEKMPAVFRHPLADSASTNAGYFVLTGPNTLVGPVDGKGLKMADCWDGLSNTLLAVESRRDIPWTKPDDLPYSAKEPVPPLGGWFESGFHSALGDGSVHFLNPQADEMHLRAAITRDGGEVIDMDVLKQPATAGKPMVQESDTTVEAQTRLDLKKLGLAFHGYHDLFGHFPPPVLYGPDGKTPYSWRVELLPVLKHYVEGVKPDPFRPLPITRERYNALIAESGYDLSQPWDSDANRKVLTAIPDAYRSPSADADSTNAAYFAFTGPATAVGDTPGKGVPIREFFDGTSNTLLLVEAQLDVPWTKPEDIPYQSGQPPTPLRRDEPQGSHVLFADGRVKFMPLPADAASLRIVILRNDGEVATEALKKLGLD